MDDLVYEELSLSFEKTYAALKKELARVRSGRAKANLLDNITVPYYGQPTPLSQVASIQVPEARMITIKPWEATLLKEIERAILQSDLGITPNNDGVIIRLSVPPLTEDRRKALVRKVQNSGEDAKIRVRNARRTANSDLKDLEKGNDLTEDDLKRALKKVQELTDVGILQVDAIIGVKEEDLMAI